jgi:hypothetical protein
MMALSFGFMYGAGIGIMFMDEEDKEMYECKWGFVLMLGIFTIQLVKH